MDEYRYGDQRKRRAVVRRASGGVAHSFVPPQNTSVCGGFTLSGMTALAGGEEPCRQCEIALAQLW